MSYMSTVPPKASAAALRIAQVVLVIQQALATGLTEATSNMVVMQESPEVPQLIL